MKKLAFLLALLCAVSVKSQTTSPLGGVGSLQLFNDDVGMNPHRATAITPQRTKGMRVSLPQRDGGAEKDVTKKKTQEEKTQGRFA